MGNRSQGARRQVEVRRQWLRSHGPWAWAVVAFIVVGALVAPQITGASRSVAEAGEITVYKSLTCGCCGKWIEHMKAEGLIHAESVFPASMTLMVSILLLGIGLMAVLSMTFRIGPFG